MRWRLEYLDNFKRFFLFNCSLFCLDDLQERVPDSPSPAPSLEDGRRPGSHPSSHRSSSVSSSPARTESSSDRIRRSLGISFLPPLFQIPVMINLPFILPMKQCEANSNPFVGLRQSVSTHFFPSLLQGENGERCVVACLLTS